MHWGVFIAVRHDFGAMGETRQTWLTTPTRPVQGTAFSQYHQRQTRTRSCLSCYLFQFAQSYRGEGDNE